ncbi:MAG TPA: hypothetical protein VK512_01575 [Xanthobacteraceae bacterium]|nr:hypothetical protein [Xanthobacteraceae bacterium]
MKRQSKPTKMAPSVRREHLREFARDVGVFITEEQRKQKKGREFPPTVSYELAEWFLKGVVEFLDGKQSSLDRALGLSSGKGRPIVESPSGEAYERAKRVFELRALGKKWKEITDHLGLDDHRNIEKELKRYRADILDEYRQYALRS